jgi:hypothetical protein
MINGLFSLETRSDFTLIMICGSRILSWHVNWIFFCLLWSIFFKILFVRSTGLLAIVPFSLFVSAPLLLR